MRIRSTIRSSRPTRTRVFVILAMLFVSAIAGAAGSMERAKTYFEQARAAHSQLQKTPITKRTLDEYTRLVESFRRVYLTAPQYGNSTISLMAIGELSEEMARRWSEPKYFQQAIDAYGFILREYPQSQFRFDARLAIARIYRYDLKQPEKALLQYERYLADYPNSAQSKMTRLAAAQLRDELGPAVMADASAGQSRQGTLSGKSSSDASAPAKAQAAAAPSGSSPSSALAPITDIRYWTNPESSRVVVDIAQPGDGRKLKYEAAQLSSPPRLYIDLHDTSVPRPAGGRTMEVNGDLLKRVRLAQFDKRVSRLVLDLGADTDYQISEMTNPYRLVIDVHGKVSEIDAAIPAAAAVPVAAPGTPAVAVARNVAQPITASAAAAPAVVDTPHAPALPESSAAAERTSAPVKVDAPQSVAAAIALPENQATPAGETREVSSPANGEVAAAASVDKPAAAVSAVEVASAAPPKADRTENDAKPASTDPKLRTAAPIRGGAHSLTRALGLKIGRIFIDAGHGGLDTGTIGPGGLTEKEIALDISQRLGKLITEKLGSEVAYSRNDDTFVPLEDRVAMANEAGADLFISVHLNSSATKNAAGVETYYLNFTSDPEALKVAARENSGAQETIANLQGIVRKIALQEKLDESREFAARMQTSLRKSLARGMSRRAANQFDRGVKTAPFVVLIGANMPSILSEVSFLSNPAEEKRLRTPEYRQKLAEALFAGVASYVDSLSGVKIAPRLPPKTPAAPGRRDKGAPARAHGNPSRAPDETAPVRPPALAAGKPDDVARLH